MRSSRPRARSRCRSCSTKQPVLSQSSAYRNLSIMEEAGIVRRLVHGAEHAHYELAEDLTQHHHHLICENCGLIRDITLTPRLERSLDSAFDGVAPRRGFLAATPRDRHLRPLRRLRRLSRGGAG